MILLMGESSKFHIFEMDSECSFAVLYYDGQNQGSNFIKRINLGSYLH